MPGGPPKGTDEHRAWVIGEIAAWRADIGADAEGSRPEFCSWQRASRRDAGMAWATSRDCPNNWGELAAAAAVDSPLAPLAYEARGRVAPAIEAHVPPGQRLRGVSTLVDADGHAKLRWVKTREDHETAQEVLERILRDFGQSDAPPADPASVPPVTDADLMAVYPMGDPHLGMMAWAPETGENWDLRKGEAIIRDSFDALVLRGARARRALIVNLGDFYHSDNSGNKTARAGHALDVDGRWPKILRAGVDCMVHAIDRCLEHHESVAVENVIGNHDDHSAIMLSVTLDRHYRNEPRVAVSLSPAAHRYHRFGKCLLGVTHGHTGSLKDLGAVMADDRSADWGETLHRMWLTGHRHTTQRHEQRGCVVEVFRTLTPSDAWARAEGYRSGRDMSRIVLHREWGEIARNTVSAQYLAQRFKEAAA